MSVDFEAHEAASGDSNAAATMDFFTVTIPCRQISAQD